jgi:hypothetical protein
MFIKQRSLTILVLWLHDDVAFHGEILQARPLRSEQLRQRHSADTRGPESLEGLCVLTPGLDEDVETGPPMNVHRLQE